MAETLLTAVNRVLKRVKVIQGEDGELATLTDSARQVYIDLAVSLINEVIQELYSSSFRPMPTEAKNGTITLVTSTREYTVPTDLLEIRWPLINQTTGDKIYPYPGGYEAMRSIQTIPADYTGRPFYATINPTNNKLRMDLEPTASEGNGDAFDLLYDRSLLISLAADTFPFIDDVLIALIPALEQLWKRTQRNTFDKDLFQSSLGRAARFLNAQQPRRAW